MKYIVGENASFIANGRIYKPGDEIDSEAFKFKKTLEAAISAGKLKPVEDTTVEDATAKDDTDRDKPGDDTTTGGDNTSGDKPSITSKKRKAMEKAAVDSGLGNSEEVKSLSDNDLAELLTTAGIEA